MNRRGFLSGILLACAAPAIVRADSLMRIVPLDAEVLRPKLDFDVVRESIRVASRKFVVTSVGASSLSVVPAVENGVVRFPADFKGQRIATPLNAIKVGDVITIAGEKRGDTLRIRMPNSYKVRA